MKILVVDNDEQTLVSMKRLLTELGHHAITLQNSRHAHEDIVCANPPFDAVILDRDLGTTRPSGKEIVRGLMRGRCRNISIAFVSCADMSDLKLEFPTAFFMPKPCEQSKLKRFLAQVEKKSKPPLI